MTDLEKSTEQRGSEYLTTGTVAKYCGVSKMTVLRWIEEGYLTAFRLPKGHNRIRRDDFREFLARHSMPVHKHAFKESGSVK